MKQPIRKNSKNICNKLTHWACELISVWLNVHSFGENYYFMWINVAQARAVVSLDRTKRTPQTPERTWGMFYIHIQDADFVDNQYPIRCAFAFHSVLNIFCFFFFFFFHFGFMFWAIVFGRKPPTRAFFTKLQARWQITCSQTVN